MAKKQWIVASQEGAEFANDEVGAEVELDLSHDQERAVVAAGWLEEPTNKKKKEG